VESEVENDDMLMLVLQLLMLWMLPRLLLLSLLIQVLLLPQQLARRLRLHQLIVRTTPPRPGRRNPVRNRHSS
jgi:hypothetical protein